MTTSTLRAPTTDAVEEYLSGYYQHIPREYTSFAILSIRQGEEPGTREAIVHVTWRGGSCEEEIVWTIWNEDGAVFGQH
jgi:hypothetical protein